MNRPTFRWGAVRIYVFDNQRPFGSDDRFRPRGLNVSTLAELRVTDLGMEVGC